MRLLTYTYLAVGYNRVAVLNRLNRAGIDVLKMLVIDEKRAEITISAKDRAKYFAICKNMWYNSEIRTGGILAPVYSLIRSPFILLGVAIFLFLTVIGSNLYFGNEYEGDSLVYRADIERVFADVGICEYKSFDDEMLDRAENILKAKIDFDYINIKKSGNKAVITAYASIKAPEKIKISDKDVIADENCRILKMTVYTGTPLVEEGAEVVVGQPVIGAYSVLNDGRTVKTNVTASVTVESRFIYEYFPRFGISEQTISEAVAAAEFMLGNETVLRSEVNADGNGIIVTLYYERLLFG